MMKALLGFTFMIMTSVAFSDARISAISYKGQVYPMRSHQKYKDRAAKLPEKKVYFPEKHYDVNNLRLSILRWISYDNKTKRLLTLPGSYDASTEGSLDLESYDHKTGKYKYKLTIKPTAIFDQKMVIVSGSKIVPLKIKGDAIFNANNKPFVYVEGIANIHDNQLTLSNIHTNKDNSSFELIVDKDSNNLLKLIPLNDISVTINIEG